MRPVWLWFVTAAALLGASPDAELISVRKIWDGAPHNAFTDLARFRGRWYCAFREAAAHVSNDGALRILGSRDGETWTSAALLKSAATCATPNWPSLRRAN